MPEDNRLHALDAVRVIALLLGVALHSTLSFVAGLSFVPSLHDSPIVDNSPSWLLADVFFVIHMFRMHAFFLVAGLFAHAAVDRKGERAFVKDRLRRILIPLIGAWVVVIPLSTAALAWAAYRTRGALPPTATAPQGTGQLYWIATNFPLFHLWFLYFLLLFYALVLVIKKASSLLFDSRSATGPQRWQVWLDRKTRQAVEGHVAPFVLAAPLWLTLCLTNDWFMWWGIPSPIKSLIPEASAFIGYFSAFMAGWLLHRQLQLLQVLQKRWPLHASLASALTVASLAIFERSRLGVEPAWCKPVFAACYTLASWYWVFALLGAAQRYFSRPNPVIRYCADAAYWVYLSHLPVVFFLQVAVSQLTWHWSLKYCVVVATTVALVLVSYQAFVRFTFLGAALGVRRTPRPVAMAADRLPVGSA
jgi:glucans biosynthesis protein C